MSRPSLLLRKPTFAAALTALLAGAACMPAHSQVLLDLFRGRASQYNPPTAPAGINVTTDTYDNIVGAGPTPRYDAVRRLITFADNGAKRAVAIPGTALRSSWPNLRIPGTNNVLTQPSVDVLCEYPSNAAAMAGQTNACQNWIQGAFLYTAVLMPAQGNYGLRLR